MYKYNQDLKAQVTSKYFSDSHTLDTSTKQLAGKVKKKKLKIKHLHKHTALVDGY